MNCIFCRIVAGEAEASKVYEDDRILAFMDIQPVRPGQVLVIPKEHVDHFSDIPDDLALEIYSLTHKLARAVRSALEPERVGLVVHGYGVAHAHMVIVPQHDQNDITSGRVADIKDGKVIFTIENLPVVPREKLDAAASLICEKISM
ncbi:MAG TPA: HIT family protein [Pyrinomonadaceae bacterium]|jgi:histidine triad (HIT) family protein|nr:HIT family protein [Pyrinomonadaceae bacterium]